MVTTRKRSLEVDVVSITSIATSLRGGGVEDTVARLIQEKGVTSTVTKGGWCLREGLVHVLSADRTNGTLLRIIQEHGLPAMLAIVEDATCRHASSSAETSNCTKPQNCFQSLCRIITGQQLAGAAARAMWLRLLKVTDHELTPKSVLELAEQGIEIHFQKPAGLSGAKSKSIVALAKAFDKGEMTQEFLSSTETTEAEIREALLPIKGIGPWTCDMFLLFYLEKANVLSVGDLGVRKGIAKYFGLVGKGKGYKGSLCNVKDKAVMEKVMAPYEPFQSLITYYMWIVADTKDLYRDDAVMKSPTKVQSKKARRVTP